MASSLNYLEYFLRYVILVFSVKFIISKRGQSSLLNPLFSILMTWNYGFVNFESHITYIASGVLYFAIGIVKRVVMNTKRVRPVYSISFYKRA